MRRIFLAAITLSLLATGASAGELRNVDHMPILTLSRTADDMPLARIPGRMIFAQADQSPTMPAPTVTVSMPKQTVAFGDYAGAILQWMLPILLPLITVMAGDLYVQLRTKLGLTTTDAQRDKFGEIVANGVALGAHDARASLAGKMTFEVKDQIMATAVGYAKAHAADTIKVLGLDPTSPEAEEAIRARVAKFLADAEVAAAPQQPTI
jgi:hypothetical protein